MESVGRAWGAKRPYENEWLNQFTRSDDIWDNSSTLESRAGVITPLSLLAELHALSLLVESEVKP